jgi:hypothetical protein
MIETNVNDFIGELGGGVVVEKIAHLISETALATVLHGAGKKKGKLGIEFTFTQVGENEQVIVSAKISQAVPTKRGKTTMEDSTDTPMFVGKGGETTANPPREEQSGQFTLSKDHEGIRSIKQI